MKGELPLHFSLSGAGYMTDCAEPSSVRVTGLTTTTDPRHLYNNFFTGSVSYVCMNICHHVRQLKQPYNHYKSCYIVLKFFTFSSTQLLTLFQTRPN